MNNRLQMDSLRCDKRKSLTQIKAKLAAEYGQRARARAVFLDRSVIQHILQ
ncbi:hypothetical protein D3C76_1538260 [compost metagenome]